MEWIKNNIGLVIGIVLAVIAVIVIAVMMSKKNKSKEKEKQKMDELEQMARALVEAMGGKENVSNLEFEQTRLKFEVKDAQKVDEKAIRAAGVMNINRPSRKKVQVMVGPRVEKVYEDVKELL